MRGSFEELQGLSEPLSHEGGPHSSDSLSSFSTLPMLKVFKCFSLYFLHALLNLTTSTRWCVTAELSDALPFNLPGYHLKETGSSGVVNIFVYLPCSSSLTAHRARTSLRVCVTHQRSPTGAFTCQRFTPGTVATSNTTAQHRLISSALTLEA